MQVTAGWRVHVDSKLLQERGARCQEPELERTLVSKENGVVGRKKQATSY